MGPIVKVVSPLPAGRNRVELSRQVLSSLAATRELRFTFDITDQEYDWLVVYEDFPKAGSERRSKHVEQLRCPPSNTILFTTEPSSIKIYPRAFTRQFAHVVTSQEPEHLRHPGRIWTAPGLRWFYGAGRDRVLDADFLASDSPEKSGTIATVCSTKRQGHTLHSLRYDFTQWLSQKMPELAVFGRGHRPVDDKSEAIAPFRYHLAIENHMALHHFTEKLADSFLGLSLPFYFGCPNAADYFPSESFIPIDIRKPQEALLIIQDAIATNQYERRLPAIREARRRILEQHSLFPLIARVIAANNGEQIVAGKSQIRSQRAARAAHPILAIGDFVHKQSLQVVNRIANLAHIRR